MSPAKLQANNVLSPKEVLAVKELRERMKDLMPSLSEYQRHDVFFARFLRARDMDLDKAEEMLRKMLHWRKCSEVDTVIGRPLPQYFIDECPILVAGKDKVGDVVVVLKLGKYDVCKGLAMGYRNEFITFAMQYFEFGLKVFQHLTTKEDYRFQSFGIVDLEGFQLLKVISKDTIDILLELVRILQSNYPENLKCLRLINAPRVFTVVWSIINPVLTARSRGKIQIYGGNKEQWKAMLREEVDPENLPSEYGGAISHCPTAIFSSLDVFPRYKSFPEEELTSVPVEAGMFHKVEFELPAGAEIAWNFKTEGNDIGFRVHCDDLGQDIVPYARVDSHLFTQKGLVTCKESGKYSLVFDNSYSMFTTKTLRLVVKTYNPPA